MPLKLIPPGKRKNNPFYLIRGTLRGKEYEASTETKDPIVAERFRVKYELAILESRVPGPGEILTFARAAELYSAFKEPPRSDQARIDRLVAVLGTKLVAEVQQADLVSAANTLYPGRKNETKNRAVIKPGAAILHYAAENHWCAWLRIKKFDEANPETRASNDTTKRILLAAIDQEIAEASCDVVTADDKLSLFVAKRRLYNAERKRILIIWLFSHWNRISDPLRITWDDIDLNRRVYRLHVAKGDLWREKPLDDDVFEVLANLDDQTGFLFPWRVRSSVYNWLRPLTRRLGVRFTPHMARHYGGKQLNRMGIGLKTIMGALDHSDAASSLRYQDADLDIVREAMKRLKSGNGAGN